jgi:hypothetical protein
MEHGHFKKIKDSAKCGNSLLIAPQRQEQWSSRSIRDNHARFDHSGLPENAASGLICDGGSLNLRSLLLRHTALCFNSEKPN